MEIKKNISLTAILSVAIIIGSCKKEKADEPETVTSSISCEDKSFTYTNDVAQILNTSCAFTGCHNTATSSSAAGINLDNYTSAKAEAEKARFLNSIRHENTLNPMPKGGSKLSDEKIKTIECWIEQGFSE